MVHTFLFYTSRSGVFKNVAEKMNTSFCFFFHYFFSTGRYEFEKHLPQRQFIPQENTFTAPLRPPTTYLNSDMTSVSSQVNDFNLC